MQKSPTPEFDRRNLTFIEFLGGGAFGDVYSAKAHGLPKQPPEVLVAVKVRLFIALKGYLSVLGLSSVL